MGLPFVQLIIQATSSPRFLSRLVTSTCDTVQMWIETHGWGWVGWVVHSMSGFQTAKAKRLSLWEACGFLAYDPIHNPWRSVKYGQIGHASREAKHQRLFDGWFFGDEVFHPVLVFGDDLKLDSPHLGNPVSHQIPATLDRGFLPNYRSQMVIS